jgi:hypothetical protein
MVNGAVPPDTVTFKVVEAPAQMGARGAIEQVGLAFTTSVAVQVVVQPAASVTWAV